MNPTKISLKVASLSLVSLFAACTSGDAAPSNSTPAASCTTQTASLATWLQQLTTDGRNFVAAQDLPTGKLSLVKLAASPTPIPEGVTVEITPEMVTVEGAFLGPPKNDPTFGFMQIEKDVAEHMPPNATEFQYLIDGRVPWSAVAALVDAVLIKRVDAMVLQPGTSTLPPAHVTFVFTAGKPGTAAAPGASAIDADLAKIMSEAKTARLASGPAKDGGLPGKVFKECPQVVNDLFPKLADANTNKDWSAIIDNGLPKAIAACSCKVEMASVRRLMWNWWRRDLVTYTGVSAMIAENGTKVIEKPDATWADIYPKLVDAAKQNKSLVLQ